MVLKKIKFLFPMFMVSISLYADWHERKAEGWIWFEENKESNKETKIQNQPILNSSVKRDPEKELEEFKLEFDRKLKTAVWDPTPENVLAFQKMQLIALEKSSEFSRVWQQNLLAYPQLDPSIQSFPTSQYGIQIQKLVQQEKKEDFFRTLSQKYGLLFFYEGDKLTSQATGEVVKRFSKKYDWQLYGASIDDHLLDGIENQSSAKKLADLFNISIFPSLFLVDPENNQLFPIAYGMVSQEKIEENIALQFSHQEGGK
jgi:conjugal transfer pilus assembly protein TraF